VLFSLQFHEASIMVGFKIFKHCTNLRFVSIVHSSVAQPRFCAPHAAPKSSSVGLSSLSTNL